MEWLGVGYRTRRGRLGQRATSDSGGACGARHSDIRFAFTSSSTRSPRYVAVRPRCPGQGGQEATAVHAGMVGQSPRTSQPRQSLPSGS